MSAGLDRRAAVAALLEERGELLVVAGLGSPAWDLHAAGDHALNFYLWGAMGSAALMAYGLARARPDRAVLAITGDGEQLMGLGGLATIAVQPVPNLSVVVLDNGRFGETGMQPSHTELGLDLAAVAAAMGFAGSGTVTDMAGVAALRDRIHDTATGPRLHVVRIRDEPLPRSLPPRDAVLLKTRFRAALGLSNG